MKKMHIDASYEAETTVKELKKSYSRLLEQLMSRNHVRETRKYQPNLNLLEKERSPNVNRQRQRKFNKDARDMNYKRFYDKKVLSDLKNQQKIREEAYINQRRNYQSLNGNKPVNLIRDKDELFSLYAKCGSAAAEPAKEKGYDLGYIEQIERKFINNPKGNFPSSRDKLSPPKRKFPFNLYIVCPSIKKS